MTTYGKFMRPKMIIRACETSDYPALKSFDEFIGDRRIDMQQGNLLVAVRNDVVVGYARVAPSEFMGWPLLSIICVAASFRGQGIGKDLVESVIAAPRLLRLYTSTEASNVTMQALLRRCSAREIGFMDELNMSGEREVLFRLK